MTVPSYISEEYARAAQEFMRVLSRRYNTDRVQICYIRDTRSIIILVVLETCVLWFPFSREAADSM